jgi:hypothetical protein
MKQNVLLTVVSLPSVLFFTFHPDDIGSHIFRAYDSADGVMDLPADAPGRTHRRGGAELFLRHTAFLRSILLLANSIDKMKNKVGTLLIAKRKIAG